MWKRLLGAGILGGGGCGSYYAWRQYDNQQKLATYKKQYLANDRYNTLQSHWQHNRNLWQATRFSVNKVSEDAEQVLTAMTPLQQRLRQLEQEKRHLEANLNATK